MPTAIAILGCLAIVGGFFYFARKAGKDAVAAKIGEQNADTAKRIADTEAKSDRSLSDLRDGLLRDPARKL